MEKEVYDRLMTRFGTDRNPFAHTLNIFIDHLDDDRAEGHMDIAHSALNPSGFVHGGAIFSFCDTVGGTLAAADGHRYVTQSSSVSFLGNQPDGTLKAAARLIKRGTKVCVVEVTVTGREDMLVAVSMLNFFKVGE